jgi:hypothetical protein
VLKPATRWLENKTAEFLGLETSSSPEAKYIEESSRISLRKQEVELKLMELRLVGKQAQLEKGARQPGTVSVQTEVDVNVNTNVVVGALEVIASPGGLVVPAEQQAAYDDWQYNLSGQVIVTLGKRGSGKSALAAKLGEFMQAVFGVPVFWLGIPETAQPLLPSWVRIVDSLAKCPNDCFILVDESGLNFLSLEFAGKKNVELRRQLMLCRQRQQTIIFCAQSSRDVDESIIRQCNTTIFKEPPLFAPDNERSEIRPKALKASQMFKQIPKGERINVAYVFDENFEGPIKCSLPTFWSEELSTAYGNRQLTPHSRMVKPRYKEVTDSEIIKLWEQDYGYESISRKLNCSNYRVRKCLAGRERANS